MPQQSLPPPIPRPRTLMGRPASEVVPSDQTGLYLELVGKLAWAVGSTYLAPYHNMGTEARRIAHEVARKILSDHGYPTRYLP